MYTDHYHFSAKPFQLSPDPRFFFGSRVHARALAYLRYGLSQGEGFIVITGGIGTGKTTLVKSLFQEFDPRRVVAAQLVTTQLEADELLRSVVASFGLPYQGITKATLLKYFEDFLQGHARQGRRVLLVVDEAQNLPPQSLEELRMLSNFQAAERPLLQSFLLGHEEFYHALQAPGMEQLHQRVIAASHLSPLSETETHEYIEHRLRIAGWDELHPTFKEGTHPAIYRLTQGIPRLINVFCDRLLLYGFLENLQEFSPAAVDLVAQEMGQVGKGHVNRVSSSAGREGGLSSPNPDTERRLTELEETINTLLEHPAWQDAQFDRMEARIIRLESAIQALHRQLSELSADLSLQDELKQTFLTSPP